MKTNLFKNFRTLKEVEEEKSLTEVVHEPEVVVIPKKSTIKSSPKKVASKKPVTKPTQVAANIIATNEQEVAKEDHPIVETPKETTTYDAYKKPESSVAKRSYTVFMKYQSLEFIKDLVFYKATAERQIFYNQSDALVEGIELIRPLYKGITERPDFIKEQEKNRKGGRKRNSDEVFSETTTCYIPVSQWDFVKDVAYHKVIGGNLYFKDWDLIEDGIKALQKKYGSKVQPRPDYIREDEMLRGRRSKTEA